RKFRCVGACVKHTFAAEYAARIHTVKPADKFTASVADLDAVGDPFAVKFAVNIDKTWRYPRPELARTHSPRTGSDHGSKIAVERKCKLGAAARFCQAARNMQVREIEHGAVFGTEPRQRHSLSMPRENAFAVRFADIRD